MVCMTLRWRETDSNFLFRAKMGARISSTRRDLRALDDFHAGDCVRSSSGAGNRLFETERACQLRPGKAAEVVRAPAHTLST